MDLRHLQTMLDIPLQQRWNNHDIFYIHTSDQTFPLLVHDHSFFCIRLHVVADVISGNVCVLEDWWHLSKLPFQVVRSFQVYFQGTKHPVFHHCS
jgi:hypothetical protein